MPKHLGIWIFMRSFYSFRKYVEIWYQHVPLTSYTTRLTLWLLKKPHPTHFSVGFQTYAIMCLFIWLFSWYVELTMENSNTFSRRINTVDRWKHKYPHIHTFKPNVRITLTLTTCGKPQCNSCFGLTLNVNLLFKRWDKGLKVTIFIKWDPFLFHEYKIYILSNFANL